MPTLLFGSIGSIVETSELQRLAFNQAFREAGLDWDWSREDYRAMLRHEGGRARIKAYAQERNETVDAEALHAEKSRLFQLRLDAGDLRPRPGVAELIGRASDERVRVGFVSTTTPENVASILKAVEADISRDAFALVMDSTFVSRRKPDPEPYEVALKELGAKPTHALAIEDNSDGVRAALAANIETIAFPGENTREHDYDGAVLIVQDRLDPDDVLQRLHALDSEGSGEYRKEAHA